MPAPELEAFSSRLTPLTGVLGDFLRGARRYDRISGYFASSILDVAGEPWEAVDRVRILTSLEVDPDDVEAAKRATGREQRRQWRRRHPLRTGSDRNRYERLAQLIESGTVEIRLLGASRYGFVHAKVGIIDQADGRLAFNGSANETAAGWDRNYEVVWATRDADTIAFTAGEFETLWNDPAARPLAECVKDDIRWLARHETVSLDEWRSMEEPDTDAALDDTGVARNEGLWEYQRAFVLDAWRDHVRAPWGARRVLADEPGLGKTVQLAALVRLAWLLEPAGRIAVVVPASLVDWWRRTLHADLAVPCAALIQGRWVLETGRRLEADAELPRSVAIVSQGLLSAQGKTAALERVTKADAFSLIVVDEAHACLTGADREYEGQHDNQLTKVLRRMLERTQSAVLATATPMRNRAEEFHKLVILAATPRQQGATGGRVSILGSAASPWRDAKETMERLRIGWNGITPGRMHRWLADPNIERLFPKTARLIDHGEIHAEYDAADPGQRTAVAGWMGVIEEKNPFTKIVVRRLREDLEKPEPRSGEAMIEPIRRVREDPDPILMGDDFREAYEQAGAIFKSMEARREGNGLLRMGLLRALCSSVAAGRETAKA